MIWAALRRRLCLITSISDLLWLKISKKGVEEHIKALHNAPQPYNVAELHPFRLRSFMHFKFVRIITINYLVISHGNGQKHVVQLYLSLLPPYGSLVINTLSIASLTFCKFTIELYFTSYLPCNSHTLSEQEQG